MTADFEQLIRQNSGRIRRIALRYADPGETDDLIQDILLALWRSHGSFRGESKVETWLYRVALNTAMASVRKSMSRRKGKQAFDAQYRESSAPASMPEKDILSDFLNSLSDVDASVLMMTLDGMTPQDMEAVLGTSANALAVRVSRVKQKFIESYVE